MPAPKARLVPLLRRSMSRWSGSGYWRGSRLAAAKRHITRSPARSCTPSISTSSVTTRNNPCTGDSSRNTSFAKPRTSAGSARSRACSSGCSISSCMPAAMALVVVSLPATSSCEVIDSICAMVNGLPSGRRAFASSESRSFRGDARLASSSAAKNRWKSRVRRVHSMCRSSEIIMPNGSTAASDQVLMRSPRLCGKPSTSAMTRTGMGMANADTNSQRPASMNSSMQLSTTLRMAVARDAMARGRNGGSMVERTRVWSGGSLVTMVLTTGYISRRRRRTSGGGSFRVSMLCESMLEKTLVLRRISRISW